MVRPGISGWAQVNQGHVAEVDEVRKLQYDFYYVKYFSPWLDLLIVLRTVRTMVTASVRARPTPVGSATKSGRRGRPRAEQLPTPCGDAPLIVVSANSSWALLNYRLGLLKALQNAGFTVAALIPLNDGCGKAQAGGNCRAPDPACGSRDIPRVGSSSCCGATSVLLRDLEPAAYLGFTIKPNIYGALAGRAVGRSR